MRPHAMLVGLPNGVSFEDRTVNFRTRTVLAALVFAVACVCGVPHTVASDAVGCILAVLKEECAKATLRSLSAHIGKFLVAFGESKEWIDTQPPHILLPPPRTAVPPLESHTELVLPDRVGNDDPFDPRPGPRPWRMTPPFVRRAS